MSAEILIRVPNVLGDTPETAEIFLTHTSSVPPARPVILDLSNVKWICPYGSVILFGACRYLTQLSGQKVRITALSQAVHAYLRRIDFFQRASEVALTTDTFYSVHDWSRKSESSGVLELVSITSHSDVYQVGNRARKILKHWLKNATEDIDRIVSLLAEACSNVVDHSSDIGMVVIQKYERVGYVDVQLAIYDFGIGIRQSLINTHGDLHQSCADYIQSALEGLTSRHGRGGQGLGAIQRIATTSGGRLSIRSETGFVLSTTDSTSQQDGLSFFPGTQVAVTFRSQLY